MIFSKNDIPALNQQLAGKNAEEIITFFIDKLGDKIVFGSSLGAEDQIITKMIANHEFAIEIFTLDTGRLFPETYDLISSTRSKYKINFKTYFPDYHEIQEMVNEKGMNLFYESIENRKHCCLVRKLNPLKRAIEGKEGWFTGLRREQSVTRVDMQIVEWDDNAQVIKVNPLINWTESDVWNYIKTNGIPYNPLHDKDFPSIGCQPCTRAVVEGEDVRAGRWWWENPESKECGLHKKH